jgi:hypothetical protein
MELCKLSLFISNISHDVIMFHRQHQKRAHQEVYRGTNGVQNIFYFYFLVNELGLCNTTPGNLP